MLFIKKCVNIYGVVSVKIFKSKISEDKAFVDKEMVIENLKSFDDELFGYFNDTNNTKMKCYIVGGSAFMLWDMEGRVTRDIDVIDLQYDYLRVNREVVSRAMYKHYINKDVLAYYDKFPVGFEDRAKKLDIDSRCIDFYVLSLEDLVISKLCTTRYEQDVLDIQSIAVLKNLDWNLLDKLAKTMESSMISSQAFFEFTYHYKKYIEEYKKFAEELKEMKDDGKEFI